MISNSHNLFVRSGGRSCVNVCVNFQKVNLVVRDQHLMDIRSDEAFEIGVTDENCRGWRNAPLDSLQCHRDTTQITRKADSQRI